MSDGPRAPEPVVDRRIDVSGSPLAMVVITDDELRVRGVHLHAVDPESDEAGPLDAAELMLSIGPVELVRHRGHPELGLEVRVPSGTADPVRVTDILCDALFLPPDRIIWVRPATSAEASERWARLRDPLIGRRLVDALAAVRAGSAHPR